MRCTAGAEIEMPKARLLRNRLSPNTSIKKRIKCRSQRLYKFFCLFPGGTLICPLPNVTAQMYLSTGNPLPSNIATPLSPPHPHPPGPTALSLGLTAQRGPTHGPVPHRPRKAPLVSTCSPLLSIGGNGHHPPPSPTPHHFSSVLLLHSTPVAWRTCLLSNNCHNNNVSDEFTSPGHSSAGGTESRSNGPGPDRWERPRDGYEQSDVAGGGGGGPC